MLMFFELLTLWPISGLNHWNLEYDPSWSFAPFIHFILYSVLWYTTYLKGTNWFSFAWYKLENTKCSSSICHRPSSTRSRWSGIRVNSRRKTLHSIISLCQSLTSALTRPYICPGKTVDSYFGLSMFWSCADWIMSFVEEWLPRCLVACLD